MATKKWAEEEESSDEEVEKRVNEPERRPQQSTSGHAAAPRNQQPTSNIVGFMMSINFRAKYKDVEDFLWDNACRVAELDMMSDMNNPKRFGGKAKVYLKDEASLENFLQLNDVEFMGMRIRTKEWNEERPAPRDSFRSNDTRGDFRDNRDNRGGGNSYFSNRGGDRGSERRPRGGSGEFRHHSQRRQDEHDDRGDNLLKSPAAATAEGETATTAPKEKAERPRIQLAPRTKPIEEIGKPERKAAIFGEGSAHDEFEYEKRRKEREAAAIAAGGSAAAADTASSPPPAPATAAAAPDGSYSVQPPSAATDEDQGYKEVSSLRTRQRGQGQNNSSGGRGSYKGAAGASDTSAHSNNHTGSGGRGEGRGSGRGHYKEGRSEGRRDGRGGRGGDRNRDRKPSSDVTEDMQNLQIDRKTIEEQDAALAQQLANNPVSPANPIPEGEGFITVDRKRTKPASVAAPAPSTKGDSNYKRRPASSRGDGPPPRQESNSNKDRGERSERPASAKGNNKPRGAGNSNGGTAAIAAAAIKDATASSAATSAKPATAASTAAQPSKPIKQQHGGLAGLAAESDDE